MGKVLKKDRTDEQAAQVEACFPFKGCKKALKAVGDGVGTDEQVVFVQENCQNMPEGKGAGKKRRSDRKNGRKNKRKEAKKEESNSPDLSGGKDKSEGKKKGKGGAKGGKKGAKG